MEPTLLPVVRSCRREARLISHVRPLSERTVNNDEALQLLEKELATFRDQSYEDLVRRISSGSLDYERSAASAAKYQVGIQFLWDDRPGGNIRVMGLIDDGGWRAFLPLTRSFIKSADGSFVRE
jgi:hypothetical protein